jgi:ADP-ribosylglycohydrolase
MSAPEEKAVVGCLLGTAVGDALGLCAENLSPRRQRRLFPRMDRYHFLFGHGMTSDDTEHACMTGQALLASGGDPRRFARSLAWRLRWWLLGLPAGTGRATLLASMKLWLGFPPHRSGIFSAGNGPAMRAPLLGVCYGQDRSRLRELVRASTLLTHKDPKAEYAALAVAWAAHRSTAPPAEWTPAGYQKELQGLLGAEAHELLDLVGRAVASAAAGQTSAEFAAALGLKLGVTGYVYHTVPVVLQTWFRHPEDLRGGLPEVIGCGGDTDTTAAILGGMIGARVGREGIPAAWLSGLWEWPRSVAWMERLGRRLAEPAEGPKRPLRVPVAGLLLRNVLFFVVVMFHVIRRWLPPY